MKRLRTIAEFAEQTQLSRHQVDTLLRNGKLQYVLISTRKMIPDGAWEAFLDENTVTSCPEETPAPAYDGLPSGTPGISPGLKKAAAGSAARARQIGNELKSRLRNSSTDGSAAAGRVIPMKS